MAINDYSGWEKDGPLGAGGQSEVFLVRSPERVKERQTCVDQMRIALDRNKLDEFASLSRTYARPEDDSALGALKVFKIRHGAVPPGEREIHGREVRRFQNELKVLKENLPGLPTLLDYSEDRFWIITERFREGSLKKQLTKFKGNALLSLVAFRSVVATVKTLHDQKIVHRDIKPANVFVRRIDELVLGDLGIVFLPDAEDRPTEFDERVGPRDYMAPWLDTGEMVVEVNPSSDVYMLGKLLWCMVSGRLKLFREHYRRPQYDLTKQFPDSTGMEHINSILDQCVVPEEHLCLQSAGELLVLVDETIKKLRMGDSRILPDGHLDLTCLMCGKGKYKPKVDNRQESLHFNIRLHDPQNMPLSEARVRPFVCDFCTHHAFFAAGYPEEAEKRGWPS
jgi:serine/threonine protein kinase